LHHSVAAATKTTVSTASPWSRGDDQGFHVALILGAALFLLTACQPAERAGVMAQSAGKAPALSKADVTFINAAATSGLAEVAFAQLAATKATDPAVRRLVEQIIADLTTVNQQLAALAQSNGIPTPSDMGGSHQEVYRQLQSLNGPGFDRAYINSRSDPQVQSFAEQHLPMMLEHLRTACAWPACSRGLSQRPASPMAGAIRAPVA